MGSTIEKTTEKLETIKVIVYNSSWRVFLGIQ